MKQQVLNGRKRMNTVHIIADDSPLYEESCPVALCGTSISRAVFVWALDGDSRFTDLSTLGSCTKCREEFSALSKKRRMLYGATDGSELGREVGKQELRRNCLANFK